MLDAVSAAYSAVAVGPPTDPTAMMGRSSAPRQRDRCERFVALAEEHGGKVAAGGRRPAGVRARATTSSRRSSTCPTTRTPRRRRRSSVRSSACSRYDDLDDAVRIANDSVYGLSAQVYGADVAAATAVARRLRTGAVNVNTGMFSAYAPSGGYKQSGLGRERGPDGIRAFQEVKHMAIGELHASAPREHYGIRPNLDWLISVDDHMLEPPNVWVDRVPAKDRDACPAHGARRRQRLLGVRGQALPDAPG